MTKYKDAEQGQSLTVSVEQAAKMLGVSPNNALILARKGQMPGAFKVGKLWRVSRARLVASINGTDIGVNEENKE